jgi:hypothetical protein
LQEEENKEPRIKEQEDFINNLLKFNVDMKQFIEEKDMMCQQTTRSSVD